VYPVLEHRAVVDPVFSGSGGIADLPLLFGKDAGGFDPVVQCQLGYPRGIDDIGSSSGDILDENGVGDDDLVMVLQGGIEAIPVDAGGFCGCAFTPCIEEPLLECQGACCARDESANR